MFEIGLIEHLEGPANRPSVEVYQEVADLVQLADELGARYAWFTEHHGHVHHGHLPTPLLMALHLAGITKNIHLGMAVTCLNLHLALDVAEQVAVADALMHGRLAPGFGSGATPQEAKWFGVEEVADDSQRHRNFENALKVMQEVWQGGTFLPQPSAGLMRRCWIAVNSEGAAKIAGRFGANILFSHLKTIDEHKRYVAAYRASGGKGLIAMNRPVYVADDDASAITEAEPALRILWRRFQQEGKILSTEKEPKNSMDLCGHPINFLVGGPATVWRKLYDLHSQVPFDVMNVEIRWDGISHDQVIASLRRLMLARTSLHKPGLLRD